MRAVVVREQTGPRAAVLEEVVVPEPGQGQVRVRLEAAALNNSDLQAADGGRASVRRLPFGLGQEGAGRVDAIGHGVDGWVVGERVAGHIIDSLAEYGLAAANELVRIPEALSPINAAALPVSYLTAGIALVFQAAVQPGEWVLIQSAGGAVGSAAVQLARLCGARVIATAGTGHKRRRLAEIGAEHVLDSADQPGVIARTMEITGGRGIDVGLDGAGRVTYATLLEVLGSGGRICLYGTTTGLPQGGAERIFVRNGILFGLVLWTNRHYLPAYGLLADRVIPALLAGRINSLAENVYPLEKVPEALELMASRSHFGKVAISI